MAYNAPCSISARRFLDSSVKNVFAVEPNNGLTGIFSLLNSYSGRLFLPIPPERVL